MRRRKPFVARARDHAHQLAFGECVFERLRVVFYAGAALPQATWERIQALAKRVRGEQVWLTTSWGSTETSPAITSAHWKLDRAGIIGLPLPGLELKFVAESTATAIMGREAAYTGKVVTFDDIVNGTVSLAPPSLDMKADLPTPPVPMPGGTTN